MTVQCDLRPAPHLQFPDAPEDLAASSSPQSIVLAGGCFWCVEAVYRELDGVLSVTSGYAGDEAATANYEAVCSGRTQHAEVVRIEYDPARLSFGRLLKIFFTAAHDPTQLDRQGNDRGRQYRSAVFYETAEQRRVVEAYIRVLDEAGVYRAPIVTRLEPLVAFFPAETYHQDYARRNPHQPYIAGVSMPKVEKVRHYFSDTLHR